MRNKGQIFTRYGTTVIGLNIVNAKANTYSDMVRADNDNIIFANLNVKEAPAAVKLVA